MKKYTVSDSGGSIEIEAESARKAAEESAESYDTVGDTKTSWGTFHVVEVGSDDEDAVMITVQLDPEEPDCRDGFDHVWKSPIKLVGGCHENPGVRGHGGGVIVEDVCMICGCKRIRDTWAQNPENGEQGLESIEYIDGEFSDEVEELAIARAKRSLDTGLDSGLTDEYDFVWEDTDGDVVGCDDDDDDLADYGYRLLTDEDAEPCSGTQLSAEETAIYRED